MRKAGTTDKRRLVEIFIHTFGSNPGVNWLLKDKGDHVKKIRRLAIYAVHKAYIREGAFISSNGKGMALCYRYNYKVFSAREVLYQLRFALLSIAIRNLPKVLKRESYRKSKRPGSGNYLYFWFLGVLPGGEGAVFDLRDGIFELARQQCLPIYLETAMERTMIAYERYGFENFHLWEDPADNIKFWFMKWEP